METVLNVVAMAKCIEAARLSGCPKDQTKLLLDSGYVPLRWQWLFHSAARRADLADGPVDIGVGGARGPGKSHVVLSQAALDDCQRINGLKGLFLRQTGVSAKESFDDLIDKVVKGRVQFEHTLASLKFPNGSKILLGGFEHDSDIDKYIGIEYDFIIVEELNQLTGERYKKLRGSLRTSKSNWRPRMYTSFNPGGIGHDFVKKRYVIPKRENKIKDVWFIDSNYKQNPYLNKEYIDYLESLEGSLGKAWRDGDWDTFEGMYFSEWDIKSHVCEPFAIPDTWFKYRSIDPSGREGVTSCHWYAVDSNGRVYAYKEYYATGRDIDEHAKAIARLSQDRDGIVEDYRYTVVDTAAFAKAGYSETTAEIYERNGVIGLIPGAKERVVGWNGVHTYLRVNEITKQPLLKIFKNCYNLIRTIPLAQHDELHPEDVADINNSFIDSDGRSGTEHQDALDELRYFLRTLRETKAPKPLNAIEKHIQEHIKRQSLDFNYRYTR